MLITTDFISPVELTGYIRPRFADLQINRFTLSGFMPNDLLDDLDYRVTRRSGAGFADVAAFRSFDTESPLAQRKGFQRIQGELPPISQKVRLGEYDRLRQRRVPDVQVRDAILDDADRMVENIAARMELARSEALVTGSLALNENGVQLDVDYGRRPDHEVTPTTLWSDAASDPVTDLIGWYEAYVRNTGAEPGVILTSTRVVSTLLRNPAMRTLLFPGTTRQPSIVTREQVYSTLSAFGLPPIERYDAQVANAEGNPVRVIPDNRVLFLPARTAPDSRGGTQLGATFWGTTAESLDPGFGLTGDLPGLVAGTYSDVDPVALWTKVAAIGLPVMINPDLSMVATVL